MPPSTAVPEPLVADLLPRFSDPERARPLLTELVADWRREAGDDPDANEIVAVLREELENTVKPLSPAERDEHLVAEVLDRRLRVLSRRTWAAATGLQAGTLDDAAVRAEGRAVLAAAEALSPQIDAVGSDAQVGLRRALEDVVLEGLYLAERGVMSHRFTDLFGADTP